MERCLTNLRKPSQPNHRIKADSAARCRLSAEG
jgi:hypothetical protein